MAEGLAQVESAEAVNPALISIEGGWQIGYLLERNPVKVDRYRRHPGCANLTSPIPSNNGMGA